MSGVQALTALAAVIHAAQKQGKQAPMALAVAVDSAQMLMCPETAADLVRLRKRVAELESEQVRTEPAPHRDPDVSPQVLKLRTLLARQRTTTTCRCAEPGADPYTCEADDCSAHFSELSPFGSNSRPVNVAGAEVSRVCGSCKWRTSVWHVDDGSAEAELHDHTTRVHGDSEVTP